MKSSSIPYMSLSAELKKTFGRRLYKLSLNAGFSCPNRDGKLDHRGCIFCSAGGSGDFAQSQQMSINKQIHEAIGIIRKKHPELDNEKPHFIAYFQAFTNTYAPIEYLLDIYTAAISHPEVALMSIATRPDCLPTEVLDLLAALNQIKPVWIELGLQSAHDSSADFIRRGYPYEVFETAVTNLNKHSIQTIVHVIIGLPHETPDDLLRTIHCINQLPVKGIKLQLLHVLKGTDLALYYEDNYFEVLSEDDYCELISLCISHLRSDIIIHRLTGDGPKELLIAPLWSLNKRHVLNHIHQTLKQKGITQGCALKQ